MLEEPKIVIFSKNEHLTELININYDIEIESFKDNYFLEEKLKNEFNNLFIIDYFEDLSYSNIFNDNLYYNFITSIILILPDNRNITLPDSIKIIRKPLHLENLIHAVDVLLSKKHLFYKLNDKYIFYPASKILIKKLNNIIQAINLTEKETSILDFLISQNSFVTKEEILKLLWNYNKDCDTHTLETHIYRLRQKLGDDQNLIASVENGYILNL